MKKYVFKNLDPKHLYLKEGGEEEEGRKLWVKVKDTDDIIEINLDKVSTTRCGSGFRLTGSFLEKYLTFRQIQVVDHNPGTQTGSGFRKWGDGDFLHGSESENIKKISTNIRI